jgi:Uma2 family endonuclease
MNIEAKIPRADVIYPESDGQPMAENTRQFETITTIKGGLDAVFMNEANVFIAGDLFWYPVEGNNQLRMAPDIMVVFGRPKGHRGSYQQWLEGGIAPRVTFEILSRGNRPGEMIRKFQFYEQYGVAEYYIYDPENELLDGWLRKQDKLAEITEMDGWTSPALGIRFQFIDGKLQIFGPDSRRFATYLELVQRAERLAEQLRALGVKPVE